MSYHFGATSLVKLRTCHEDLQSVLTEAIKLVDFSVLCGHRTEKEQNLAYDEGRSQLRFPLSLHNQYPSLAVDIAPWPINWGDKSQFYYTMGMVIGVGHSMGIKLRHGGDWNMNGRIADNRFNDLPHLELFQGS